MPDGALLATHGWRRHSRYDVTIADNSGSSLFESPRGDAVNYHSRAPPRSASAEVQGTEPIWSRLFWVTSLGAPPIANEASQTSLYRLRSQPTTRRDRATQYPAADTSCKMSTDSDEHGFSDRTVPQRVFVATGPAGAGLGRLKAAFPGLWLDALLHWSSDLVAAPISFDAVSMASFRIQLLQFLLGARSADGQATHRTIPSAEIGSPLRPRILFIRLIYRERAVDDEPRLSARVRESHRGIS